MLGPLLKHFNVLRFDLRDTGKSGWGDEAQFNLRNTPMTLRADGAPRDRISLCGWGGLWRAYRNPVFITAMLSGPKFDVALTHR